MDNSLYMQLYRDLSRDILSGRLKAGDKLPSKRQMCALRGVSQSTVETAYGILLSEGYIYSRPKSGFFVSPLETLDKMPEKPAQKSAPEALSEPPSPYFCRLSGAGADTSIFPYSSWAKIAKEVVYNNPHLLQRGLPQGDLELRQALCSMLHSQRGVNCTPEQIVIGAGMDYLLEIILRLLPEDTIFAAEDPGYNATYGVIEGAGRKICPIKVDDFGMCAEELKKSGASVAYLTPSHQYPLGVTMPASRRTQILKWAEEKEGRFIIEDDYDSEFRYSFRPVPAIQGMGNAEKVIYISTFSRSLAPSMRIAYTVLPPSLLEKYRTVSRYLSSTVSRFEQHTLCRFITEGLYSRHLRRAGNLYREKREILTSALKELSDISIHGDGAGLHFFVTHRRLDEQQLILRAKSAGVLVRPLSACYHGNNQKSEGVILDFAEADLPTLKKAAAALAKAWE